MIVLPFVQGLDMHARDSNSRLGLVRLILDTPQAMAFVARTKPMIKNRWSSSVTS